MHSTKTNKLPINRQSFVLLLSPVFFLFLLTLDEQYISLHLILSLYHLCTHLCTHTNTRTRTNIYLSLTCSLSLSYKRHAHAISSSFRYTHTRTDTTCYLFLSYTHTHTTFQSPRRKLIPLKLSVDSSLNYLQLKFFQTLSLFDHLLSKKNFFSRLVWNLKDLHDGGIVYLWLLWKVHLQVLEYLSTWCFFCI